MSDSRELRRALGCFATGIVIVSAAYEGREHGMTANAFTSVSLEPPLVLVCIDNNARMSHVLEIGMHFGLSILSAAQREVSQHFAGRSQARTSVEFTWARGVPLIAGACAHFICRLADARIAGDHTLYIGAVEQHTQFDASPLVFHGGGYARLNTQT